MMNILFVVQVTLLTHEEIRNAAIQKGRRPTIANQLQFSKTNESVNRTTSKAGDEAVTQQVGDNEQSLKSKLCLYVESLYAAIEVGVAL